MRAGAGVWSRSTSPCGRRWSGTGGCTPSSIINELHVSVAEHNGIIKAIRKGDEAAVHGGLARNWSGGFERISRLIEIFGERGSW